LVDPPATMKYSFDNPDIRRTRTFLRSRAVIDSEGRELRILGTGEAELILEVNFAFMANKYLDLESIIL